MTSTFELTANFVITISILLAGRNSIHTWWTGILGCILFAIVFYQAQLFADVTLQIFFVVASAWGWWQWACGRQGQPRPISNTSRNTLITSIAGGLLATIAYGLLLHYYTHAYAPFLDSAVLTFSVIAQLLLMQRRIDNWLFWLAVNSIAVPLYASRGLYLTSALYAVYWINALISWQRWKKIQGTESRQVPAASRAL